MRLYPIDLSKYFNPKSVLPVEAKEECEPAQEKKSVYKTPFPGEILMSMDRVDEEQTRNILNGYPE